MEAPIAIAAGLFAAYKLVNMPSEETSVDNTASLGSLTPEEIFFLNAQVAGTVTPNHQASASRIPWRDGAGMPYFVHQPGQSNMDSPVTDTYTQILNAHFLDRKDFEETFQASRPQYARTKGMPPYMGFTGDMKLKGPRGEVYSTQHMNWSWLPTNPTDSDWNDAGLLAKALPPDPLLFTPNADFATAPGLDFRYSAV